MINIFFAEIFHLIPLEESNGRRFLCRSFCNVESRELQLGVEFLGNKVGLLINRNIFIDTIVLSVADRT